MSDGHVRVQAAKAAVQITGTRWCSNHSGYAPADTGEWVGTKQGKRWRCATCSKPSVRKAQWRKAK